MATVEVPNLEVPKAIIKESRMSPIVISLICIGIILFILVTQCEISNIKLQAKDASLVLIILALLAYINGYNVLFMIILGIFVLVYFAPPKYINKFMSFIRPQDNKPFLPALKKSQQHQNEDSHTETEITLDTDIDDITIQEPEEYEEQQMVDIIEELEQNSPEIEEIQEEEHVYMSDKKVK